MRGKSLHFHLHSPLAGSKALLVRTFSLTASLPLDSPYFQLLLSVLTMSNKFTDKIWALILQKLVHIYLNVLKSLGMKCSISASLCRIRIALISKKFKKQSSGLHSLFLQVNLLQTVRLFYYLYIIVVFIALSGKGDW